MSWRQKQVMDKWVQRKAWTHSIQLIRCRIYTFESLTRVQCFRVGRMGVPHIRAGSRGRIFSCEWPFYERPVSDQDHRYLCIGLSRSLTAHSEKGRTQLEIWPLVSLGMNRLSWKRWPEWNALAYYSKFRRTVRKSFITFDALQIFSQKVSILGKRPRMKLYWSWGQCYKTFFGRNSRIFVIS